MLAAVVTGAGGEVDPVRALIILLDEEFIVVLMELVGNINQNAGIADGLLEA